MATGGCWIKDPKTGEKVAGMRGPDGIAVPIDKKPAKPAKAKE